MPGCIWGYDLQTHHIVPINKGGDDTFENFIVLCGACHRKRRLHKSWGAQKDKVYIFTNFIWN